MRQARNIILISIDDGNAFWRYRDVFGERLQTPNLERIFAASTAFTSAYCQSPICGPSRASMLSGLSPHQTGIVDNYTRLYHVVRPDHLWQFRLKQKGYYCSTAGKVHHAFSPQAPELHNVVYSHPPHALNIMPPNGKNIPVVKLGGLGAGTATTDPAHDTLYYDKQSADNAIAFLESYDRPEPFYREIGFLHPHLPYKTPLVFKELYNEDAFTQPADWAKGFDLASFPQAFIKENFDFDNQTYWRKSVRNYFSAYSHVDYHIGRVWDALQTSPHIKDTILILISDHGYHLGDKHRFRKSTIWEECTRIPLLIWDPQNPGGEVDDPVGLIDIGPTILDYAGCRPLKISPGRSLRGAVESKQGDPDRAIPSFKFDSVGMRTGPWRITLYPDGGSEFHDVEKDMWLTENLAGSHPDYEQARRKLTSVCAEWGLDISAAPSTSTLSARSSNSRQGIHDNIVQRSFTTDLSPGLARPGQPEGAREYITYHSETGHIQLSPVTTSVRRGSDGAGPAREVRLSGNLQDNDIELISTQHNYTIEIDPGPGNNRIHSSHERVVVHCGDGDNIVFAMGGGEVHGGIGSAQLQSGNGHAILYAGPGGINRVIGGRGSTEIFSGHGCSHLQSGLGKTQIVIEGGRNTVDVRLGSSRLIVRRTGLPQIIHLGRGDLIIDLSDWATLGPVVLQPEHKTQVWAECVTERILFKGWDTKQLLSSIIGVELMS